MANSADTDQLASSEANWSGSSLFANAGYIQVNMLQIETHMQEKSSCIDPLCVCFIKLILVKEIRQNTAFFNILTSHFLQN